MSLAVLAVLYLPLVLWMLWKILKQPMPVVKKVAITMLVMMLAYVVPLGDVTINSMAMAKACPSAGLHIYKTVEVNGYSGDIGGRDTLDRYPYRFIETTRPGGQIVHYEKGLDGPISVRLLEQPTAEYEVVSVQWHFDNERNVETSSYSIRNRITRQILAEYPVFKPLPGWVDRLLVYRWFGSGGRQGCFGAPADNFIQQVLIPKKSTAN
jgi:hypothetical protein